MPENAGGFDVAHLERVGDDRDRLQATRAVRLEATVLALEGRHVRDGHGFAGTTDVAMERIVDVQLDLRRKRGERGRLDEIAILGVLIDDDDDAELQFFVGLDDGGERVA